MKILFLTAHPDDAEYYAGGLIRKYTAADHEVKVISLTTGGAGHHELRGQALVERRKREAWASSHIGEFKYQILNNHDAQLYSTMALRDELIAIIRSHAPDAIFTHRPYDYHPDHRNASLAIQDAAYLLTVPSIVPREPMLERVPMILHLEDQFMKPIPFEADVAVSIDDTIEDKINMLDAHVSQFYEWLPFNQGVLDTVPKDKEERKAWLGDFIKDRAAKTADRFRILLGVLYGKEAGNAIKYAEAFEACEYGMQMTAENRKELFPFF